MKNIKSAIFLGIISVAVALPSISIAQSNTLDGKLEAIKNLSEQSKSNMTEDEQAVMNKIREKFPGSSILENVKKVNDELYQVWFGGQLSYTNKNLDYMLTGGSLIDVNKLEDITEPEYSERSSKVFEKLPLDLAVKKVYGDGEKKLALFVDPDCPYCAQFEQTLDRNKDTLNLTTYTFLMPLTQLHPNAYNKSVKIMCSSDMSGALSDLYLNEKQPQAETCSGGEKVVDYHGAIAESFGFAQTPTLVFENNEVYPGALPYINLQKVFDYVYKDK